MTNTTKRDKITTDMEIHYMPESIISNNGYIISKAEIISEQKNDTKCRNIINYLCTGELPKSLREQRMCVLHENNYIMIDDVLMFILDDALSGEMKLVIEIPSKYQDFTGAGCLPMCENSLQHAITVT